MEKIFGYLNFGSEYGLYFCNNETSIEEALQSCGYKLTAEQKKEFDITGDIIVDGVRITLDPATEADFLQSL